MLVGMRTSEVAERAGVNTQTLRCYERRGLLASPPRSTSGYRDYPASAVILLRFVKRVQQLGFCLDEAEELMHLAADGPRATQRGGAALMRLTILHVPGCPNVAILEDRLTQARAGRDDVDVARHVVDNEEVAVELGMGGSPTLLIDGVDPFAEPGRSASVSCRLYRDETGHLTGAPSAAQLRDVLDPSVTRDVAFMVGGEESTGVEQDCCSPSEDPSPSWSGLSAARARTVPRNPAGRAAHQAILQAFATTGYPPAAAELEQIAAAHGRAVGETLAELHTADVIRLDAAGQVRVAYPFSATPTRHRVQLTDGAEVYAMCAVDALGMPAMLDTDAVISSSDPTSDQPVTVTVHAGRYGWEPATAVVFLSAAAGDGPSADCCCNDLNFFTTRATAQAWSDAHPQVPGQILDPPAAERLGQDIFRDLLGPK